MVRDDAAYRQDPAPDPASIEVATAPVLLLDSDAADRLTLRRLRSDPRIEVIESHAAMISQLRRLVPSPSSAELAESGSWVFYPWRRTVVSILGPLSFGRLRLDRNRNKISSVEQAQLRRLKIGVVGLSVGHAIAHTLAIEGLCGELRLADFDTIELSNLNRIPASILDLGANKAAVAARRIAEIDPYLTVTTYNQGLTEENMAQFLDGLDLVIEECDSLDIKVRVREGARARGIPVLMETSDRGLFDVERFDLDPDRPLFHGLVGTLDPRSLAGLATRDKAPHVMRILQAAGLSTRMAASMVEIGNTVTSWPQLGSDIALGAATVAAAVRRFGRGEDLPSGRMRIDLDRQLADLGSWLVHDDQPNEYAEPPDLTFQIPQEPLAAVVQAIRLAPSGGNSQPWTISPAPQRVDIKLAVERSSAMDVGYRGSYVAIGAAGFNARVAAAEYSAATAVIEFPDGAASDVVLSIDLDAAGRPVEELLSSLYPAMIRRISNRNESRRSPIAEPVLQELLAAARSEGATLRLVTDADQL
ncbi:MAG: Rv1355c family protein, partial [Nakamurella sp.]